jgi:hypothetical protein
MCGSLGLCNRIQDTIGYLQVHEVIHDSIYDYVEKHIRYNIGCGFWSCKMTFEVS